MLGTDPPGEPESRVAFWVAMMGVVCVLWALFLALI